MSGLVGRDACDKGGCRRGSDIPYANVVAGVLVLVIGFGFHWIGQLVSVLNWDLATRIGIQEAALPPEYKVHEHAIAVADVALGWIYGLAGLGLVLGTQWGSRLPGFPV